MKKVKFESGEIRDVTSRHAEMLLAKGLAVEVEEVKEVKEPFETKEEKKKGRTKKA